ncbi:MAG: helix-turn-helix domain-containing protein [Acidobacteria bacterium]|nr:helix-turn-helix domain-containing protein [Acidobacteriota bacterium]
MDDDKGLLGLSAIRRNRGISLEQIAESTKISVRSLEAIERGEFSKLPGGIYNTSYIRQYARAIDYDESAILAAYQKDVARRAGPTLAESPRHKDTYGGGFRAVAGLLGL